MGDSSILVLVFLSLCSKAEISHGKPVGGSAKPTEEDD